MSGNQDPQKLVLEAGQIYSLKVLEIKKRNKQVLKSDQQLYNLFDIVVQDKHGRSVSAEYLTKDPTADAFVVGVSQYVRCGIVARGTPEIEPADEPVPGLQQRIKPPHAAIDKSQDPGHPPPNQKNDGDNAFSLPISGRSITFSMAYAKDILVAEIAMKPCGYEATEADLQRMIRNANIINNAIIERVQF